MSIRFGIVGCGVIHGTHGEALRRVDGAELAAVYDIVPAKGKAAAEKFGVHAAKSLNDLFSRVDAVTVCVPSGLHAKIGVAAAKAGKHVLVEKPIDVTLGAATRLVEAARQASVKLGVISQHRFAEGIRELKNLVERGALGKLIEGDAYNKWYRTQGYYDSGDWRGTWKLDGGGCLMNQGVHYVDMIQWVMGGVESVQAQMKTATHEIEVEDVANALITYRNGATGVIQGSTSYFPGLPERLEVHGSKGSVLVETDKLKLVEIHQAKEGDDSPYGRGAAAKENDAGKTGAADPAAIGIAQHLAQVQDFVDAIRENREPFVTGEMAIEPLKVILAIYRSAKKDGAKVRV